MNKRSWLVEALSVCVVAVLVYLCIQFFMGAF